tara:strand:+ start:2515 stop:2769 length:255 start_codon:yes stop_codon:yes gene_type:complete
MQDLEFYLRERPPIVRGLLYARFAPSSEIKLKILRKLFKKYTNHFEGCQEQIDDINISIRSCYKLDKDVIDDLINLLIFLEYRE